MPCKKISSLSPSLKNSKNYSLKSLDISKVFFGTIFLNIFLFSYPHYAFLIQKGESKMNISTFSSLQDPLIEEIKRDIIETSYLTKISKISEKTLTAIKKVPRHLFVDPSRQDMAYENRALSIGYGQTISQPFIVALMTELLDLKKDDRVLEIGTGSGYQAAILGQLTKEVYSVEIVPELAEQAKKRLQTLGYKNVHVQLSQGSEGWVEHAPYNKIIVTAAAENIPSELINQLKPNGILVIPIGKEGSSQMLTLIRKDKKGSISKENILPVVFVPFKGTFKKNIKTS